MAQFRGLAMKLCEDARRTITVLNIGRVHHADDQVSACVSQDVALAALDLFPVIKAKKKRVFRRFHALAVDHARP